jgi:hypothetical protein
MRFLQLVILLALPWACARVEASRSTLEIDMRHVHLRVAPDAVLHVHRLRGRVEPTARRAPTLNDKTSYVVAIDSGEIGVDAATLNALMARSLGGDRSNLDKLQVTIEPDGTLRQRGAIDKGVHIPFSARSRVSASPDGRIRLSTESVRGFGLPMKSIMKIFGLEMDSLLTVSAGTGVEVRDNDVLIDPSRLIPAPSIRGRVAAVRVERGELVQVFASGAAPSPWTSSSPNHIHWRGGELSFGRLTMVETDLELVDQDPGDPFDFSVDGWQAQLVAGYSRTLANNGLRAYLPDHDDLERRRKAPPAGSPPSARSPRRRRVKDNAVARSCLRPARCAPRGTCLPV